MGSDLRLYLLLWTQGPAGHGAQRNRPCSWDIAGKRHNVPCWQLLGGKRRDRVRGYFTGPDVDLGLKLGFTAFKQPINLGPADGQAGKFKIAAQLKAVREKIGPDHLLMIDVLRRWNVDYTVEMADRLAP